MAMKDNFVLPYTLAVAYEAAIMAGLVSSTQVLWGGSTCLAPHTDDIKKPAQSPDYLLGEVTQHSDSRLSETKAYS